MQGDFALPEIIRGFEACVLTLLVTTRNLNKWCTVHVQEVEMEGAALGLCNSFFYSCYEIERSRYTFIDAAYSWHYCQKADVPLFFFYVFEI